VWFRFCVNRLCDRKSVDELLTLNRSTTLARFAEHNLSEARDLFLRHSAGSEEASYVQFMVLLAALGLKEVYGDAFDSFAATAFQRLDRNSGSAQYVISALTVSENSLCSHHSCCYFVESAVKILSIISKTLHSLSQRERKWTGRLYHKHRPHCTPKSKTSEPKRKLLQGKLTVYW